MARSLVAFSALVGGFGLGLAVAYVMLVVVAFMPGGDRVATFMVGTEQGPGYGYALIVVPYALLLLHLWLRVNVASQLLEMEDLERARSFAERRLKVGLLRGKREALANRTALMRIACREQDYERVEELAAAAELPRRGIFGSIEAEAAFHRWRLEALLRRENLVAAKQVVVDAWPMAGRGAAIADFCACAAELAVRNDAPDDVRTWRERSRFAADPNERMQVVELLAAVRFDDPADDDFLNQLNPASLRWLDDVPGAGLEVAAALAQLRDDEMSAADERFVADGDARSQFVWQNRDIERSADRDQPG